MTHATSARLSAASLLIASLATSAPSLAQTTTSTQGGPDTSTNTSLAVKLVSRDRGQTGTATLTQAPSGVHVDLLLDQAPGGNATAAIVKGSCPAVRSAGMPASEAAGSMSSNGAAGSDGSNGATTNGATTSGASSSGSSSSGASSSMGGAGNGPATYTIGKVSSTQGGQGQAAGSASTTIANASLSSLTGGSYAIVVGNGAPKIAGAALCGDIGASLPPMTPAGVNKSH